MNSTILSFLSILIFSSCALAQSDLIFKSGFEFVSKLNDTGITWSGGYPSGNLAECTNPASNPSPQDCNTGRDFAHNDDSDGHAGFSFTKLDADGVPLVNQSVDHTTEPWPCVRDNVTGLVWEVKTTTAGIHHKDNTYKWGGITAIGLGHPGSGTYYNDWDELVNGSNTGNGLCGFTDWRVPTVDELTGLANYGTFNPAIDTNYFPNTVSTWFWSASPVADDASKAWFVIFHYGDDYGYNRDYLNRVRLVRGPGQ